MLTQRRLLLAVTAASDFTLFLLIFTVSRGLAEAGADLLEMGLVGGIFSLFGSVASALGGRVCDRLGRYRVMAAGLALALLGEVTLLASAPGSASAFAGYFAAGAAIAGLYPPIMAELTRGGDAVTNHSGVGRVIILFCIAWNLGLIAGQLTGGALFATGRSAPLLVAVAATLASAAVTAVLARRPREKAPALELTAAHHDYRARSAAYVPLAWMANLGGTFAMSMIFHLFPKLMVAMDVDPEQHGWLLAFSRVVIIATYFVMYRTVFWHHSFATMAAAEVLAVAGLATIALAPSVPWLVAGLALLAQLVGVNYFASMYYSTSGSHDEDRGAATGLHEATMALGLALGSIGGGWAGVHWGDRSPYLLAGAVILAILGAQVLWYAARVRPATAPAAEAESTTAASGS